MSAKTKIVVLRMKEVIYSCIFAALGILFIILLVMMFLPGNDENTGNEVTPSASDSIYIPGIYTTELVLGGNAVDVEVIVEANSISSIQLVNLSDAVTTMYPLLEPTFDSICNQIYETQSTDNISYTTDSKYTSLVLLEAIRSSLDKARPTATPSASPATTTPTTTASPAATSSPATTTSPAATAAPSA